MSRSITVSFARRANYAEALFRFDDGKTAITVPELPELLEGEQPEELWSQTLRPAKSPWMYAIAADSLEAMCRQNDVTSITTTGDKALTYYVVKRRFTVFQRTFKKLDIHMIVRASEARAAIVRVRVSAAPGENAVTAQTLLSYHPMPGMTTVYDGLRYVEDEILLPVAALSALTRAREGFWSEKAQQRIRDIIRRSKQKSDTPNAPDRPPIPPAVAICLFVQPMLGLDAQALTEWMNQPGLPEDPDALAEAVCDHLRELFAQETPKEAIARFSGKEGEELWSVIPSPRPTTH